MWFKTRRRRCDVHARMFAEHELLQLTTIARMAEEEENMPHRGSVVGRRTIPRDRYSGYFRLMQDYFIQQPVYGDNLFRRRFRMSKNMFNDICEAVAAANRYFRLTHNAAGQAGFSTIQKVTAALRMLAYGGPADSLDEYFRMGESTIIETLNKFTRTIVVIYGEEYLRQPNTEDIARLLRKAEERGFPGMLGSIDCMHWEWEKCPTAWHGQYRGHHKKPTIILEAVASHDLWVWHAFFGMPGSCNDINVLHRSPVFDNLSSGHAPEVNFTVNGREYNMGYYLADGIYPPWATLITPIPVAVSNKQNRFNEKQQEYRKDVERTFGVLQAKYAIIKGPSRMWDPGDMKYIVQCVIILHNMGIKYERGMEQLEIEDYEGASRPSLDPNRNVPEVQQLINAHRQIQSRTTNEQLKNDLVDHIWNLHGSSTEILYKSLAHQIPS